jgi:hypothetical protein
MFEETNQAMGENEMENLPDSLFGDDEADTGAAEEVEENESGSDSSNPGEAAGGENGENHAGESTGANGSSIRVKYNGEERDISLDEARTLAQKGLNYDHVVAERDKNREAFAFLLERAKSEGMTVEQFIENERGKSENQRLEEKKAEIRARDDDASEDTVENLARLELELEKHNAEKESAKALEEANKKQIEGWNKLFRQHPELMGENGAAPKVSQKVFDLVNKEGLSPIEAYYTERNRELEEQNKVMTDSQAAKKKSVGSMSGDRAGTDEDEFLAGFNSI